jgi:hypothetical protein
MVKMNKKIILWTFLLLFSFASVTATELNDSGIAYYNYDSNILNNISSYDLTNNGADSLPSGGIIEGAYDFIRANSDYMTQNTLLDTPPSALSFSFWFKLDSDYDVTDTDYYQFMSKNNINSDDRFWTRLNPTTGNLEFTTEENAGGTDTLSSTTASWTGNTWYHVVLTWGSNGKKIYINGNNEATSAGDTTIMSAGTASDFYIGSTWTGANYLEGIIDEIMVANTEITPSQVTTLYNGGSGFNPYNPYTPTPSLGNYTITVVDEWDSSSINNVSITIDETTYINTTGNTIYTNITVNESLTYTINVTGENYQDRTFVNKNLSSDSSLELFPNAFENFNLLTPQNNESRENNYNITWSEANSNGNYDVTYNIKISYLNGTLIKDINQSNVLHYLWNNTNESVGNYSIIINATEQYTNDSFEQSSYLLIKPINDFFKINAYNYLSTSLLSNIRTNESTLEIVQTSNPYIYDIFSYLNSTSYESNHLADVTIEDLTFRHIDYTGTFNITRFNNEFNVTLTPNKLLFTFYQNGALHTTEGVIHDTSMINSTYGFSNSSIVLIQQELEQGYVKAKFGMTSGVNWTQYYEYINDYENHVDEEIEILQNSDWSAYLQVLDYTNSPIKDVTVRAQYVYTETGNWTSFKLLGQRLTNDEGYTFFIADSSTEVLFTISKDGYAPVEALITIGDESFTKAEALTFYLQKSSNGALGNAWIYVQRDFSNRSLDLSGTITAKGRERVQVQTSYRDNLDLSAKDITSNCDDYDRCDFTLISGTDFKLSSTDDIILYVYLDNNLWKTLTINYDNSNKNRVLNFSGLESKYLNPLLAILILFLTLMIGLIFRSTDAGTITFFVSSLLAGMISTSFLWLTVVITLYFIFKLIKRVISE